MASVFPIRDSLALVTGAGSGIGRATAERLAREGARVIVCDVNEAGLEEVRASLGDRCVQAARVDVSDREAMKAFAADVHRDFGALDVLVNNAGVRAYEPLAEAQAQTWERILAVNLLGYAYLAREALPALRRSGRGAIVNVSSTHAVNPRAGMGQYDVAKAGVLSMTRTLAFEEAPNGVRVNAVCPGLTLTPFHVARARQAGRTEQDLRTERVDHNLQRRWADAREVACPILWLASDEASFCTASTLMVDGGTRV